MVIKMGIIDRLKDKYLTWRTGKSRDRREFEWWCDNTVVWRAPTVENMFMNFKHIIQVNPDTFFDHREPFGWVPVQEVKQYLHPVKPLGENAIWTWVRGRRDQWDGRFHFDEMGGGDHVFVATNNDTDAIMIALRWS